MVVTKTVSSTMARKYLLSGLVQKKYGDPNPGSQCDRGDKTLSKSCSCLPPREASEMPGGSNPGRARRPDQLVPSQSQLFPLKANVLVTREISLEIYSGAFFSFVFSPGFPSIQPNVSM